MTLQIAGLVLLSAILHPLWNAFLKNVERTETGYLILTLMMVAIGGTHSLLLGYDLGSVIAVWPLLLASWGGQLLYGSCLVGTLRRGDLSAYYPIIRSSPALVVLIGVALLGQSYSWILLIGIAMVLLGGFLLQRRPGMRVLDDPRTLSLALLSMTGTAIYSIADSHAMRSIQPSVLFFWVEALCLPSYFILFCFIRPDPIPWRSAFTWVRKPVPYLAAGCMCYASYWLILLAYKLGGDVAAVISVRQMSIPISVLIGGLYLSEGRVRQRLLASLILAAGIVMIVTG